MLRNDQPQHLDQLPPDEPGHVPQRRVVLIAGLSAGFAFAANPVMAQVITTPTDGLTAGEVKVPTSTGNIPAYRAMPSSGGPFPTVLVVEEIFGVHEHIRDVCRRFATLGYYAIAPELFARQGDATKADIPTLLKDIVPKKPDAEAMTDLDATLAFAKASGSADTARLGTVGYCWGGRIVWLYAAHNPGLKAAVAFYGILGGKASPSSAIKPKNPVDFGSTIKVPVLGLYGGKDDNIPPELIKQMQDELKQGGTESHIVVYPDTPHGFFADYRPSYRPEAAKDAWAKVQAWFKEHGVV
jgi:carboxymethylenebutenolidase